MYDNISTADAVSRWNSLGVKLPKELATAVEVFEAIRWVETGHTVPFDLADITAANAEEKLVEFANRLLPALKTGDHLSRTPLEEAKRRMLDAAAREVLGKATAAVPVVIEQLTPEFDKHAAAYVAAVASLPDIVDSDSLVQAGPLAVQAYMTAQTEAAYLDKVSSWVAGTRDLPGFAGLDVEVALRTLRPADALQLAKLDAAQYKNVNQTLGALDKVLYTAAREGIEFGINTLRECAEIRRSLAITPQNVSSRVTMVR
ncbi:hypothetical protein SIM91_10640 [Rhodococcus opacus]|uniref:hypothetical protein n=1 Tax=Rhodococcus opacus TaxID=37919 RepID=UPI0007CD6D99|nr:hypothetical protein [Rhodococcus opacus]MDX5963775.1 hypothetical protein [Rhodococcus opacus]NKY75763.1 hypothetical protein [Rhodococcus opacus]CAG7607824.1 hypothetical protein E143388_05636 [Rhodococcus opacus]